MPENTPINATASPIKIEFPLSSEVTIETNVGGDARNIATEGIKQGTMTLWTTTLTQGTPTATAPYDILCGQMTINKGATFTLTIPTSDQPGNVVFSGTIVEPTGTQTHTYVVATWPLNS